jgi:hypothetical protein
MRSGAMGWRGFGVLLLALLAGCAAPGQGPRERTEGRLDDFMLAAGEPVESFRFWQLQRWEALGRASLAVWTRPDEAYLLQVDQACWGLEFAQAIGLTSNLNRVTRRFDAVTFDKQRCRIEEIRPVNTPLLSRGAG